jgi:peptide/nickel transport system permease protein
MRAYIIKRLLLIIPTFILVTMIVFLMVRFIPGDIVDMLMSQASQAVIEDPYAARAEMRHQLGLDVPIYTQYGRWMRGIFLEGNLGNSLRTNQPVSEEISTRIAVSLELGLFAIIIALVMALPIGIFSALRQDTWGDYVGRSIAILYICLPTFWVGTMVVVYPSILWGWSPDVIVIPFFEDPVRHLIQFLIPGAVLGMAISGTTMRMTRTMMLEVLRQDYIRTAWAKGLRERVVVIRHALRNALIPVVTIVGLMMPILIGGAVVTEQVFALPGMGRLLVQAVNWRDYPVISGINVLLACFILVVNLVIDLTYAWLDPRVKYQ